PRAPTARPCRRRAPPDPSGAVVPPGSRRPRPGRAPRPRRTRGAPCHGREAGSSCAILAAPRRSDRCVEQRQPPRQILFDRELLFQLRLELELARVVALLVLERHEGPERPELEPVDPVHRLLAVFEAERGGEESVAEPLRR